MTAIVAVRKGKKAVIASDSLTSFGRQHVSEQNYSSTKIRKIGNSYVALSGYSLYKNILDDYLKDRRAVKLNTKEEIYRFVLKFWKELKDNYTFVNNQSNSKYHPFADLNSSFLVLNKNGIFTVSGNMTVTKFKQYYSIGSGSDYCMGAMHSLYDSDMSAKQIARAAIGASITFDPYCGGKIRVKQL
ncbi:MAG: hypothetical protein AB8G77_16255 [Rhodothermales bacterium]